MCPLSLCKSCSRHVCVCAQVRYASDSATFSLCRDIKGSVILTLPKAKQQNEIV